MSLAASSISIASFVSVIEAPAGIIGASFGLTFSTTSGFIKKFLKTTRNKKKKYNKIVMLTGSKLNSIESKISDLADMQLTGKFNKGFRFLLCAIDIFSNYAWVVPLKDKKGVSIVNAFQKILDDSNRKPNKKLVDKGSEFYNNSFKNG